LEPVGKTPLTWLIYNVLPNRVITVSEAIRKQLINYNKFNPEKIVSIPTGVDLSVFDPQKVKLSPLPKNGFLIGMIAVFLEWKGHKYFISAVPEILKEIPFAQFYIIGNGNKKAWEKIEKQIHTLNLKEKIHMLGFREDIPQILSSLDILVHPSYNEGLGQVILQGLAMKKPVVAINIGGITEIIKHRETGFMISAKNPHAIASAVIKLYENPDLRKKLGEKGRKLVEEKYSFNKMIDKIEEVYKNVASHF
jgi:glycosyltransferase involved in cell wall biosynthesis